MEPRKRTHLVNELMQEAHCMMTVLEQAMAAKQREAHQRAESHHITDDEPNPPPAHAIQDEHISWGKVVQALTDVQSELQQIAQSEHERLERGTPSAARSERVGKDTSVISSDSGSMPRKPFTLAEAQRWIGQAVITKTAFEVDLRKLEAEQQGTVIGVHGEHALQGDPIIRLAVQFWPAEQDALPEVFFFDKRVFDEYLCLSHTVESPTSA